MPGSRSKPTEGGADWKVEAIKAVKAVAIRLIDRDHVGTFLAFAVAVLLGVVALRIPNGFYEKLPDALVQLLTRQGVTVAIFMASDGILLLTVFFMWIALRQTRRYYRAELERMADRKRELELRIDQKRPRTYHLEQSTVVKRDGDDT